jgi:hypothetical protein
MGGGGARRGEYNISRDIKPEEKDMRRICGVEVITRIRREQRERGMRMEERWEEYEEGRKERREGCVEGREKGRLC